MPSPTSLMIDAPPSPLTVSHDVIFAIASTALWGLDTGAAAAICAMADLDTRVIPPTLEDLRGALLDGHDFDVIAVGCASEAEGQIVERIIREAPPRVAVLVVGDSRRLFRDAATLPYDVWSEPDPGHAEAVFTPLLRSVREREALAAIEAHRAISAALDRVLDTDDDLSGNVARAMGVLAGCLDCAAASFWRPSASGTSLIRVGCTGPARELDEAAAGDARTPTAGCDRLLTLTVADTPAGEVLRSGEPQLSGAAHDSLLMPARSNGRVCGVVVLSGARSIARRRTSFELATSAADRVASLVQWQLSGQQFNAVTARSPLAIVLTDAAGLVVSYNQAAEDLLGVPRHVALDAPATDLLVGDGRGELIERIVRLAHSTDDPRARRTELAITPARARERQIELSISTWGSGRDRRYALIAQDIGERRHAELRIAQLAYTDRLSGLGNEPALLRTLGSQPGSHGFIAVGASRFERIREIFGSLDSDQVIRALAERLRELTPARGTLYHLNRAEFLILVDDVDRATLQTLADGICGELEQPLSTGAGALYLKCSAGISLSPDVDSNPRIGLDNALRGLRQALAGDRQDACFYDAAHPSDPGRIRREADLHQAIAGDQLRLHYQPVVELASGRVQSFEALLRWAHPELGMLAPGMFIPIAEESGLIVDLGAWVIREAIRQLAEWQREHGYTGRIAVNLAPRQLLSDALPDLVAQTVSEHGISSDCLIAEIVESAALGDLVSVRRTLDRLHDLGLKIALDDFGVGESSLGRLAELPVDVIKLDRSLIQGLPEDRTSRALTHGVIQLADELGLEVVSEGIETVAQRDHLRGLPGRLGQGYLFGRPMAPDEAIRTV